VIKTLKNKHKTNYYHVVYLAFFEKKFAIISRLYLCSLLLNIKNYINLNTIEIAYGMSRFDDLMEEL